MIKKSKLKEDKMYEDLLLQEIETLQLLDHPHIVRVMEILEDNENIYMASELMENGNLLQVFDKIKDRFFF